MAAVHALVLSALALLGMAHVQAAPDDPYASSTGAWSQDFADQWALTQQRIYADIAPTATGQPVIVAVIDTGLDYTHEDLAAERIWHNPNETANGRDDDRNGYVDDLIGWNFVAGSNNPWDESGHGTHIAGVIGACTNNGVGIAAVNSNAILMPLKVANFVGQARSANVAAAIYYAVDHGARVINISLGSELITDLEVRAAEYAQERNVLIVVSAGNRGLSTEQHGYAGLPGALVVGALAPNGERAGFSNFGEGLHLLAPGVDVLSLRAQDTDFVLLSDPLDYAAGSAVVGEDQQYYRASGTSFAAAVATGVASRVLSLRPDLSARAVKKLLTQTAADLGVPGHDQVSGFGGLDYLAAFAGDPTRHLDVRLSHAGLVLDEARLLVEVSGRAESSDFRTAELQMRPLPDSIPLPPAATDKAGRREERRRAKEVERQKKAGTYVDPYAWQALANWTESQPQGVLARLDVEELTRKASGSTAWELRLVVNDERVAHMTLSMPAPDIFAEAGDE